MAESGESPQGLGIEELMALADGTLLRQMGAVSTQVTTVLEDALEVARAIEAGNLEKLTQALGEAASGEAAPALEALKETLVSHAPLVEASPLARAAISLGTSDIAVGVEAFAQTELAKRLVSRDKLPLREQHRQTAFDIASAHYQNIDYDKAEAYFKKTGNYFHRIYVPSYLYGRDARGDRDQFTFPQTASGQAMTFRRIMSNTGEVDSEGFSLVLKLEPLDDPLHPDNMPNPLGGDHKHYGVLYATLTDKDNSTIRYTEPEINKNVVLAEAADRDLIEKFQQTIDGLNTELDRVVG